MDFEAGQIEPVTLGRAKSGRNNRPPVRWIPSSLWGKVALGWSVFQLVLCVAIEVYIMTSYINFLSTMDTMSKQNSSITASFTWGTALKNGQALPIYHGIFIAAQVFQVFLITDALMQRSLIQLMTTTAFNFASWGYAIVQLGQAAKLAPTFQSFFPTMETHPTRAAEISLIVIFFGFCAGWLVLSYKLYYVFGWTSYKEMGADLGLRNILHLYHIYIMLLKIDVFFFLSFDIQFLLLILKDQSTQAILLHCLISFPGTLIALVLAYYAVRKENRIMLYVTLSFCIGLIGYLSSKLYDIWGASDNSRFESSKNSLTLSITLTILVTLFTMVSAIVNMNHFGEGLQEKLSKNNQHSIEEEIYDGDTYAFEVRR